MKKFIVFVFSLFWAFVWAENQMNFQNYELDTLLHNIDSAQKPVVTDDYVIFTCDSNYRFAGIAFDFENYQTVHPFQFLMRTDEDGNSKRSFLFYCYKRQHKFTTIKYRVILDGLWTTDPFNPEKIYDEKVNLYFSKIEDPHSVNIFTASSKNDGVKFIYKGESGKTIHLSGTFTNWDPWIYELEETSPGFYELALPLTKGKHFYNYYVGLTPILDNTNPNKIFTKDGRSANVIVVE